VFKNAASPEVPIPAVSARSFFHPRSSRASLGKRLWLDAAGVALFITCIFAGRTMLDRSPPQKAIGLDFIAFYTAGHFVFNEHYRGHDLEAV
jgi:hypothetical protein